jgi:hypothetical protein
LIRISLEGLVKSKLFRIVGSNTGYTARDEEKGGCYNGLLHAVRYVPGAGPCLVRCMVNTVYMGVTLPSALYG